MLTSEVPSLGSGPRSETGVAKRGVFGGLDSESEAASSFALSTSLWPLELAIRQGEGLLHPAQNQYQ